MDRSNGFEKKLLTQVLLLIPLSCNYTDRQLIVFYSFHSWITRIIQGVNKMAQEEEAYKWSTEDM